MGRNLSTNEKDAHAAAIAATREWLERAVIGLNLCPFANAPHVGNRVRFAVSDAESAEALSADLDRELRALQAADPAVVETTLLVAPGIFPDFLDFNDYLDEADATLEALGLEGEIQIASFHPHYQFAGTAVEDIENYTNRSPHPTLHLIREASITRAVEAVADPDAIPARNIETLRKLGHAGWRALFKD